MPGWREDVGGEAVLEIQHSYQMRLLYKGHAQNGTGAFATDVLIIRELIRGQSIVKDDAFPGLDNTVNEGSRQFLGRGPCMMERDRNGILLDAGFRHATHFAIILKKQNGSLRPRMVDCHYQEFFDQSI